MYYFDIAAGLDSGKTFAEALKRFGSFFACPLFSESATGRELNAIESENAKNLQSDGFRIYQVEKSRFNSEHPYSKFFTGNKATLLDGTKRQGIDLRQELIKFYEQYYSADQMTLAIAGPQSLSSLKKYVEAGFSTVPNRSTGRPEESWAGISPIARYNSIVPSLGYVLEVVPVTDSRQLTLSWPIVKPLEDREDRMYTKPEEYVTHLLGHEGPGSMTSYLKRKGWANGLGASVATDISDFFVLEVSVPLTTAGLEAVDSICEAIFSYIKMVQSKNIPNYIFDEVLQINELQWRFLEKGDPSSYVEGLVSSMQKYPPSLYVAGPRRIALNLPESRIKNTATPRMMFETSEQRQNAKLATAELFSKLTVDNVMVTIVSKSFEGKTEKSEKWYGTGYNVKRIPEQTLSAWKMSEQAPALGIYLPRPNPFIPSEKGLQVKAKVDRRQLSKSLSFEDRVKPIKPPTLILDGKDGSRWKIYYKQDDRYGQPKAYVIFELLTSEAYSSAKNVVLSQLYELCLNDSLDEYAYDATLAGLMYNLQVIPRGVRFTFGGYNDKLQDFAAYISSKIARNFLDVLPNSDSELDRFKDNLKRGLSGFDTKQPYAHAIYYTTLSIEPKNFQYSNEELRNELASLTLTDLSSYVERIWSHGQGEALVQGNVNAEEALAFINAVDRELPFKTDPDEAIPPYLHALPLPVVKQGNEPTLIRISEPNKSNQNSASQVMFQCLGKTEKDHVLIELFNAVIEEAFYEDLRTKQQLGYIVSSGLKAVGESRNLSFIVQSSVAPAEKLTEAILQFLGTLRATYLEPLSEEDVDVNAKSLFIRKTTPDKTLVTETTKNWSEIATGRLRFDRIQREGAALIDIRKADLLEFWDKYFVNERRMIVSETVPNSGVASSKAPPRSTGYASARNKSTENLVLGVDDINEFRRQREGRDAVDGTLWM